MAPPVLSEHFALAPFLRNALPAGHRLVDVVPTGTRAPHPRVDEDGCSIHAMVEQSEVMDELFLRGAALVWGTVPAFGMAPIDETSCYIIRPGRGHAAPQTPLQYQ